VRSLADFICEHSGTGKLAINFRPKKNLWHGFFRLTSGKAARQGEFTVLLLVMPVNIKLPGVVRKSCIDTALITTMTPNGYSGSSGDGEMLFGNQAGRKFVSWHGARGTDLKSLNWHVQDTARAVGTA
jgi:hypothetical protein